MAESVRLILAMMSESAPETEQAGQYLPPGTLIAERYRIEALLGEGGMGAVYRAQHVHMQKTFAVKVLHRQMTTLEEAVRRFEREAVAAGRIDHPNIASATDFGRLPDGSFYLVLEFLDGQTLRALLAERGALAVERALSITRQAALGLGAAHAVSVVHRDLKPDNIMLVEREAGVELVKVLDFGIAQVKGEDAKQAPVTQFGAIFGTPQYMAPEQAAGQEVDQRADLYALGLILDEMLRGAPTFQANDLMALLSKQLVEAPPPLPVSVPEAVQTLVAHLLQKDVGARVQSAEELVSRLDSLLGIRAPLGSAELGRGSAHTEFLAPHSAGSGLLEKARPFLKRAQATWGRLASVLYARSVELPVLGSFLEGPHFFGISRARTLSALVLLVLVSSLVLLLRTGPQSSLKNRSEASVTATDGASDPDPQDEPPADELLEPTLRKLLRLARTGDQTALYALELRKDSERSQAEWLALAEGRLKKHSIEKALEAIDQALAKDSSLRLSPKLLSGLRAHVDKPEFGVKILNFAASKLKSAGADLLFNTYAATSLVTEATRQAKLLLFSADVKQHWSEALNVALALRAADSCEGSKKLLDQAIQYADERALKPLKDLASETGCGANKRSDCYPCLRDTEKLKAAITQAQMNKAPRYDED